METVCKNRDNCVSRPRAPKPWQRSKISLTTEAVAQVVAKAEPMKFTVRVRLRTVS